MKQNCAFFRSNLTVNCLKSTGNWNRWIASNRLVYEQKTLSFGRVDRKRSKKISVNIQDVIRHHPLSPHIQDHMHGTSFLGNLGYGPWLEMILLLVETVESQITLGNPSLSVEFPSETISKQSCIFIYRCSIATFDYQRVPKPPKNT